MEVEGEAVDGVVEVAEATTGWPRGLDRGISGAAIAATADCAAAVADAASFAAAAALAAAAVLVALGALGALLALLFVFLSLLPPLFFPLFDFFPTALPMVSEVP